MEERNDNSGEKIEEVMLPGFRFHPTDEELVGFYLRRKIQQRPLSIELIKQLDIYKYDPWDLPKLAPTGEKEWYFYCPRDRKYRNSARPNRVTGAGFWKATGTDRPIYSSEGSKCIGLKKSLVFYKGRAAKGIKTDWMMHEFRLPSLTDSLTPKKYIDNMTIPANYESWAICRIFKKTNSTTQRALSHSWVSSLPEPSTSHMLTKNEDSTQFCLANNIPILTKKTSLTSQFSTNNNSVSSNVCPLDVATYKSIINPLLYKALDHLPIPNGDHNNSMVLSSSSPSLETSNNNNAKSTITMDVSSMLLNMSSSSEGANFGGLMQEHSSGDYPIPLLREMQGTIHVGNQHHDNNVNVPRVDDQDLETLRCLGFPFGMPFNIGDHAWKSNNVHWDASSCTL